MGVPEESERELRDQLMVKNLSLIRQGSFSAYGAEDWPNLVKFPEADPDLFDRFLSVGGQLSDQDLASYRVLNNVFLLLESHPRREDRVLIQEKVHLFSNQMLTFLEGKDEKSILSLFQDWVGLVRRVFEKGYLPSIFFERQGVLDYPFFFYAGHTADGRFVYVNSAQLKKVSQDTPFPPEARINLARSFESWLARHSTDRRMSLKVSRFFRETILPQLAAIFEPSPTLRFFEILNQNGSGSRILEPKKMGEGVRREAGEGTQVDMLKMIILKILMEKEPQTLFDLTVPGLLQEIIKELESLLQDSRVEVRLKVNSAILELQNINRRDLPDGSLDHHSLFARSVEKAIQLLKKSETHIHLSGSILPAVTLGLFWKYPDARHEFLELNGLVVKDGEQADEVFSELLGLKFISRSREARELLLKILEDEAHDIYSPAFESAMTSLFGGEEAIKGAEETLMEKYLAWHPIPDDNNGKRILSYLNHLSATGEILLRQSLYANRIAAKTNALHSFHEDGVELFELRTSGGGRPGSGLGFEEVARAVIEGLAEAEQETGGQLRTGIILSVHKHPHHLLGGKAQVEKIREEALGRSWEDIWKGLEAWDVQSLMAQTRHKPWFEDDKRKKQELAVLVAARDEVNRRFQDIIDFKKKLAEEDRRKGTNLASKILSVDTVGNEQEGILWTHFAGIQKARNAGLFFTNHSGESWSEEETIWGALTRIKHSVESGYADRIGHGLALGINPFSLNDSYDDQAILDILNYQFAIMREMVRRKVFLESMPSANILLNDELEVYRDHVIHTFLTFGLPTQIAQDNKFSMHTRNLSGELSKIWFSNPYLTLGQLLRLVDAGFDSGGSFILRKGEMESLGAAA